MGVNTKRDFKLTDIDVIYGKILMHDSSNLMSFQPFGYAQPNQSSIVSTYLSSSKFGSMRNH